jgi:hypothetical protein
MVKRIGLLALLMLLVASQSSSSLPVDVTFLAIDLKFDQGNVKILEFQDAPQAGLRAYDYVFGKGGVWRAFWEELFTLNVPVWYVGPQPCKSLGNAFSHNDSDHVAFNDFRARGGFFIPSLYQLQNFKTFRSLMEKKRSDTSSFPAKAIVLYKIEDPGTSSLRQFAYAHPEAILINRYMRSFSIDKKKTHALLCNAGLESLRPNTKIYRKFYYPKLAAAIKKDLGGDLFVIKPINSSRSNGVVMVTATELDKALKRIIEAAESNSGYARGGTYRPDNTMTFEYWKGDPNDKFIVESYAPSQELIVNGKRYDPTMRAIWMMVSDGVQTTVKRLTAFWKVPSFGLDDVESLTEKHVSKYRHDLSRLNPKDLEVSIGDLSKLDSVMIPALQVMYNYVLTHPSW